MKLTFFKLFLFLIISAPVFANAQVSDYENNPVIEPSLENTFDKYRVSNPVVLKDGDEYKMYYIGLGDANHIEIGGAISVDGFTWVKYGDFPVFSCGENTLNDCQNNINWSSYRVAVVDVIKENDTYMMWYLGDAYNSSPPNFLGLATSSDGLNWSAYQANPIFPDYNSSRLEFQGVIKFNGRFLLYYRLNDGLGTYLAISDDGIDWEVANNGDPIDSKYLLSPEVINSKVYASDGGVMYESGDGLTFNLNGARIIPETVNDFTGTVLVEGDRLRIWYSNVTEGYMGGVRKVAINYAEADSEILGETTSDFSLVNFSQKRIDNETGVLDGGSFVGNGVVFEAEVDREGSDGNYYFEVELVEFDEDFSGEATHVSELLDGDTARVTVRDLSDDMYAGNNQKQFKWQARVVSEEGAASDWVEFGDDDVDFSVRIVPLVTQVASNFPDGLSTAAWENAVYAGGRADDVGSCGLTIKQCGCVLSSLSTLAYHHGITAGIDGESVTPKSLNDWMLANNGFTADGSMLWPEAMKYFGEQVTEEVAKTNFSFAGHKVTDEAVVNAKLNNEESVIAYSSPQGYRHYYVIDSLLDEGYEMSDPYWFGTRSSGEERDLSSAIQDYGNDYVAAQIIDVSDNAVAFGRMIEVHLASPAEIVVENERGERVGYNPKKNIRYSEINGAQYDTESSLYSGDDERADEAHERKVVRIFDAEPGEYEVEVIGTDGGEYLLSIYTIDEYGNSTLVEYTGQTKERRNKKYRFDFVSAVTEAEDADRGHGNETNGCDDDNSGMSKRCE